MKRKVFTLKFKGYYMAKIGDEYEYSGVTLSYASTRKVDSYFKRSSIFSAKLLFWRLVTVVQRQEAWVTAREKINGVQVYMVRKGKIHILLDLKWLGSSFSPICYIL